MLVDGAAVVGVAGAGEDGVVHDGEGDGVDEVVGDSLRGLECGMRRVGKNGTQCGWGGGALG